LPSSRRFRSEVNAWRLEYFQPPPTGSPRSCVDGSEKGYALNVTLAEDGIELAIGLEGGERVVALVQSADGSAIILTSERVVEHGRTVLRYGEVVRCDRITDEPRPRDLRRLKQTHFDRLILELENGGKVVLVGLGQAVFPMQRYFNSIISAVGPNAPTRSDVGPTRRSM
jgi:hypothetical protein